MPTERLKRIKAGVYETRDGRYRIVAEGSIGPRVGPDFQMGTGDAWWIYDLTEDPYDAANVNDPCGTLGEARAWISQRRAAQGGRDGE